MNSLETLFNLRSKTVFVTGGAGHLGSAMCEALAELGANVVIGSRDTTKSTTLATRLSDAYDVKSSGLAVDITDPESVEAALSSIASEYGGLDVLVNNAWSGKKNTMDSISIDDWKYDIDVCLNGVFYTVKKALPYLKASRGVVVNVASMYGHVAPDYKMYAATDHANPPSYGAAKAGVIQFTRYLASFLASDGIRVNAISPGPFPFGDIVNNASFMDALAQKTMLNRIGNPEELKGVIALLCSDASNYMTGQNICVDGGWTAW